MLSLTVVRVLLRIILFNMVRDILFCVLNEKKLPLGYPISRITHFSHFLRCVLDWILNLRSWMYTLVHPPTPLLTQAWEVIKHSTYPLYPNPLDPGSNKNFK